MSKLQEEEGSLHEAFSLHLLTDSFGPQVLSWKSLLCR